MRRTAQRPLRQRFWAPPVPCGDWAVNPEHDLAPAQLRQVLIVAATPRVASHFFDAALEETRLAGVPREYCNPEALLAARRRTGAPRLSPRGRARALRQRLRGDPAWENGELDPGSLTAYLRAVPARRTTANGVFCLKVHYDQYAASLLASGLDADVWGVPVRWVRLRRRDRLAQAVSFTIARLTDQWIPAMTMRREPVYDAGAVAESFRLVDLWESAWDRLLAGRDDPVLELWTEDLVADVDGAVRRTLALLGETDAAARHRSEVDPQRWRHAESTLRAQWILQAEHDLPHLAEQRYASDPRP